MRLGRVLRDALTEPHLAERLPTDDGVQELAGIPGPTVGSIAREELHGERTGAGSELRPEGAREELHVALAITQRRQLDARDGEAEEEVVAEASFLHLAIEIATRRREDANVALDPAVAADPLGLAALDRAKELRLECDVEIADFVDEERAAVGLLEDAAAHGGSARERALLVTEERRLHERAGERGTVEYDERSFRARARLVDRFGELLFAGAGFTFDRARNVGRGDLARERVDSLHRRTSSEHTAEAHGMTERSRRGGRDRYREERRSDRDRLAAAQVSPGDANVVREGAVRRFEIFDAERVADDRSREMPPRDEIVREDEIADRARAHEHALARRDRHALLIAGDDIDVKREVRRVCVTADTSEDVFLSLVHRLSMSSQRSRERKHLRAPSVPSSSRPSVRFSRRA